MQTIEALPQFKEKGFKKAVEVTWNDCKNPNAIIAFVRNEGEGEFIVNKEILIQIDDTGSQFVFPVDDLKSEDLQRSF